MTAWAAPLEVPALEEGEVHLWLLELEDSEAAQHLRNSLDDEERARADRFRFPRDEDRFVLCRMALRALLGRYLGQAPGRVRISIGRHGKPGLAGKDGRPLEFNLSHSERWAFLAFALGRPLGVDIERVDAAKVSDGVADRFFSASEAAAFRRVAGPDRDEAFFRCWTRKEAYLKARGEGLMISLQGFSVSIDLGEPARLLRSDGGEEELARWELRDLDPPVGYAGALAVAGTGWELRRWRCSPALLGLP